MALNFVNIFRITFQMQNICNYLEYTFDKHSGIDGNEIHFDR